ncbi:thioesterase, partial [Polaribacter sp.]|nr:thioesterase [Polaribacter sp.]
WVVLKHEVEYLKQAVLGDVITVKTWVGETKGFKSERLMEFYKQNQLLVKAKTIWGMLDAKSYKPSRIRENVLKVLQPVK